MESLKKSFLGCKKIDMFLKEKLLNLEQDIYYDACTITKSQSRLQDILH